MGGSISSIHHFQHTLGTLIMVQGKVKIQKHQLINEIYVGSGDTIDILNLKTQNCSFELTNKQILMIFSTSSKDGLV